MCYQMPRIEYTFSQSEHGSGMGKVSERFALNAHKDMIL